MDVQKTVKELVELTIDRKLSWQPTEDFLRASEGGGDYTEEVGMPVYQTTLDNGMHLTVAIKLNDKGEMVAKLTFLKNKKEIPFNNGEYLSPKQSNIIGSLPGLQIQERSLGKEERDEFYGTMQAVSEHLGRDLGF